MRNKKIAVYLCMSLLFAATGCSNSNADSDVSIVDTINFNDVIDTNAEESTNNQSDNSVKNDENQQNNNKDSAQQSNDTQLQSNSELDGDIESIGNNSVVINKSFHPSENTAVSYVDSGKVLVTVYFTEETKFEIWTVKNSGVNGDSDIEKRQGAFSDLNQGASINMTGNYDENDFYAKHVIIYNYV